MEQLKDVKMIITDSAVGLQELQDTVANLERYVQNNDHLYEGRNWEQCFPQRFLVVADSYEFLRLKKVLRSPRIGPQAEEVK